MENGPPWSVLVAAFDASGTRAHAVLASDQVRESWAADSILPKMTVGALAGHLLAVLRMFERRYDVEVPVAATPVELTGWYASVRLGHVSELDDEPFRIPRDGGARLGARGHAAVVEQFTASLATLASRLRDDAPGRPILGPDGTTTATLRAYTVTRIVELVVHTDDLAESVGIAVAPPDDDVARIVIDFLESSTERRLGPARTIRALAGRDDPDQLRAL